MKSIDALKCLGDLHVPAFTTNDAGAALRINRSHATKTLSRLADAGHLIHLHQGVWAFPGTGDLTLLAAYLAAPSPYYLSLQSALYAHGMISQIPQRVYLISTARTRLYRTPLGAVSIHHVTPAFFTGFTIQERTGLPLATPEKALVDFLYMTPARSRLFCALPEIEIPARFRWKAASQFMSLIASPQRRIMIETRLHNIKKGMTKK